jgi:hypothetical protein
MRSVIGDSNIPEKLRGGQTRYWRRFRRCEFLYRYEPEDVYSEAREADPSRAPNSGLTLNPNPHNQGAEKI